MKGLKTTLAVILLLCSGVQLFAETDSSKLKPQMVKAFVAFRDLQKYLVSESRFLDANNEQRIAALLSDLSQSFEAAREEKLALKDQPGFRETLSVIDERISQAHERFIEGEKTYALWEMKTVGNYCVSCHTTFSTSSEFSGDSPSVKGMSLAEKAEFLLATRQFEKAAPLFKQAVFSLNNPRERMSALRKWLVIHIRVFQDPRAMVVDLDTMIRKVSFSGYEKKELAEYRESLMRWAKEARGKKPSLRRAENLLRQSLGMNDLLDAKESTVELLRATAMLHTLLEQDGDTQNPERGRTLYLLGLSYSRLPLYFVNELPDFFLELCIRENPATKVAKDCYRLYANNTYLDFTGSGGSSVPEDVQQKIERLYKKAYGR
jgi:hypothetical protein